MTQRIIRAAACLPQPWKNGMGTTREIARFPAHAGNDDFLWRVSVAEVNSAAPFSSFPGIDRHIALLDGAGFTMTLDGQRTHALLTPLEPFAFPGEASVDVAMAGGATRDFNLMVRRASAEGQVQVLRTAGAQRLAPSCVLVYLAAGTATTPDGLLEAGDAWRPGTGELQLHDGAVALAIQITRRVG
ncbi:HutD/Ves family protein [Dyella soli]|uniref:HutD family protein n=1 Tax=Dyella soli TaxID=522319 RepID=A0A4R0YEE7_9GAMM|nr:HutD family protein [Dyella soli]TCI06510.1 HutD family protein [Dyella soli]